MFDFLKPKQTQHEIVRSILLTDIEAEKDKCWQALARNTGHTFTDREMMLDPATHELFQGFATLAADRREYGAVGSSFEALGRAAYAWLEAEVARVAEPAGGVA